ncbi:nucleotide-binding domain-containing protein [Ceraceosorus guamensis]|uniref:Nucleotide-binding domain-containing protein n=1 Tax=Ceraceosorus guamensis TaxID=1522189 RepID=A0A316WAJ5_9BASI|nr:nucleotide-binding domain-containing protein [Ceraceosorus guamensis]PWN45751.1 nucleotide-binding domain-containing protein [Ceraceosorus guamensis]
MPDASTSSSTLPGATASTKGGSKAKSAAAPKRIAIVGAGVSGLASAYSFSLAAEKFKVTVLEAGPCVGGSAYSHQLPAARTSKPDETSPNGANTGSALDLGAEYINEGVQGISPAFHNTFKVMEDVLGFKAQEVGLQISFGKGEEEFWSNLYPSKLVDRFRDDIKKFGRALNTIKTFEPIFALIPISATMKIFRFSPEFGERMVFPLVALFFGTGNETKHVSTAILERVFKDPSMRLFEFSEESLLASVPTMMAFPELARMYGNWRKVITSTGNVEVKTDAPVKSVVRGTKEAKRKGGNVLVTYQDGKDGQEVEGVFDEVIFACDADSALKILKAGNGPSWKENKVLGNVYYLDDVSVTHTDLAYMEKHYEVHYTDKYNANRKDEESQKSFDFAKKNWKPLYLIKEYKDDPALIEMSFDLTVYQPQFKQIQPTGLGARTQPSDAPPHERLGIPSGQNAATAPRPWATEEQPEPPIDRHVFQTIFLNKADSKRWTKEELDPEKVLFEKWWKQQSHRWQHYGGTVAWMWSINGANHTTYAGAWTLVNCQEVGIVSGFAAAYSLGAPYPFIEDQESARLFKGYLALMHASRARKEDRSGWFM